MFARGFLDALPACLPHASAGRFTICATAHLPFLHTTCTRCTPLPGKDTTLHHLLGCTAPLLYCYLLCTGSHHSLSQLLCVSSPLSWRFSYFPYISPEPICVTLLCWNNMISYVSPDFACWRRALPYKWRRPGLLHVFSSLRDAGEQARRSRPPWWGHSLLVILFYLYGFVPPAACCAFGGGRRVLACLCMPGVPYISWGLLANGQAC